MFSVVVFSVVVFDVVIFRVAVFSVDIVRCCSVRWVQVAARSPTDVSCLRHILQALIAQQLSS